MQGMPGARPQDGRAIALQQERDRLERYRQLGIDGYDSPGFTDQFTAPINDEIAWASGYGMQGAENIARNLTGRPACGWRRCYDVSGGSGSATGLLT